MKICPKCNNEPGKKIWLDEDGLVYCPKCYGSGTVAEEHEKFVSNSIVMELEAKIKTAIEWIDQYEIRKGEEPCVPLYELYEILTDWD